MGERSEGGGEPPKKGKGSELVDYLLANPLTAEEMEARDPKLPELQLRPDAAVEIDDHVPASELLARLATEGQRSMQIQHGEGDNRVQAVLVPVDRYLELVGRTLAGSNEFEVLADGTVVPQGLAGADVETVDPKATWSKHFYGPQA